MSCNFQTLDAKGKLRATGRDVQFMPFTMLKYWQQWNLLAMVSNSSSGTFQKLTSIFLNILFEYTSKVCKKFTKDRLKSFACISERKMFCGFEYALYAADMTFQQRLRSGRSVTDRKKYYLGEPKLYGYKVEVLFLLQGRGTGCTMQYVCVVQ